MSTILIWIVEIMTFALVVPFVFVGMRWVEGAWTVRRRLGRSSDNPLATGESQLVKEQEVNNDFLAWVEQATLNNDKDAGKLRRDLMEAGFENPSAPIYYVIIRFGLAIGLPLAFLFFSQFLSKPLTGAWLIMLPLFFAGVGLLIPGAFLGNRLEAKRTQMEQEFPDALDLLVVCVEAGLGLEAAFVRVNQEIKTSHPVIAETLHRVAEEMRAGRGRADALRAMANRTAVEPIKSFAALLIQTDALGTSIAQTLRTFSAEMRTTRFLKAEEKAMRIPVLMTIPLVACILPVIVTALLLPAMIDVSRNVMPLLTGKH
ncbi:MAG TPA: type II secretion system F family protein [Caulobacteraceae bacterium]|nr:type II secretion system F family protein [Caulobacteraceae bacterium]